MIRHRVRPARRPRRRREGRGDGRVRRGRPAAAAPRWPAPTTSAWPGGPGLEVNEGARAGARVGSSQGNDGHRRLQPDDQRAGHPRLQRRARPTSSGSSSSAPTPPAATCPTACLNETAPSGPVHRDDRRPGAGPARHRGRHHRRPAPAASSTRCAAGWSARSPATTSSCRRDYLGVWIEVEHDYRSRLLGSSTDVARGRRDAPRATGPAGRSGGSRTVIFTHHRPGGSPPTVADLRHHRAGAARARLHPGAVRPPAGPAAADGGALDRRRLLVQPGLGHPEGGRRGRPGRRGVAARTSATPRTYAEAAAKRNGFDKADPDIDVTVIRVPGTTRQLRVTITDDRVGSFFYENLGGSDIELNRRGDRRVPAPGAPRAARRTASATTWTSRSAERSGLWGNIHGPTTDNYQGRRLRPAVPGAQRRAAAPSTTRTTAPPGTCTRSTCGPASPTWTSRSATPGSTTGAEPEPRDRRRQPTAATPT